MAMAPQILAQGQQRLQGVPGQFEPRFMERSVPAAIRIVSYRCIREEDMATRETNLICLFCTMKMFCVINKVAVIKDANS